jgi:hypothetical protein
LLDGRELLPVPLEAIVKRGLMKNISFSITTEQFKARTKTVTRRLGWKTLKAGQHLMGCKKCMGLKPGEKVEKLGEIRVVSVRQEMLDEILNKHDDEMTKEGFPQMSRMDFIEMFCREMHCEPETIVTRIEFEYI